jgi:hypothetical protein
MSNWRHSFNLISLLLILAIAVTASYLYYQWLYPMRYMGEEAEMAAGDNPPQAGEVKAQIDKFIPVSLNAYGEITQRPLFVEGRLPPDLPDKKTGIT